MRKTYLGETKVNNYEFLKLLKEKCEESKVTEKGERLVTLVERLEVKKEDSLFVEENGGIINIPGFLYKIMKEQAYRIESLCKEFVENLDELIDKISLLQQKANDLLTLEMEVSIDSLFSSLRKKAYYSLSDVFEKPTNLVSQDKEKLEVLFKETGQENGVCIILSEIARIAKRLEDIETEMYYFCEHFRESLRLFLNTLYGFSEVDAEHDFIPYDYCFDDIYYFVYECASGYNQIVLLDIVETFFSSCFPLPLQECLDCQEE